MVGKSENTTGQIVSKMFMYQFVTAAASIMLSLFFISRSESWDSWETWLLVSSIVVTGFYLYLLYSLMWEAGAKDIIKIDSNKMKNKPLRGLYCSFLESIPNIALATLLVMSIICHLNSFSDIFLAISKLWHGQYLGILVSLNNTFDSVNHPVYSALLMYAIIIPSLISSQLGYIAGKHNFVIIPKKKQQEKKEKN